MYEMIYKTLRWIWTLKLWILNKCIKSMRMQSFCSSWNRVGSACGRYPRSKYIGRILPKRSVAVGELHIFIYQGMLAETKRLATVNRRERSYLCSKYIFKTLSKVIISIRLTLRPLQCVDSTCPCRPAKDAVLEVCEATNKTPARSFWFRKFLQSNKFKKGGNRKLDKKEAFKEDFATAEVAFIVWLYYVYDLSTANRDRKEEEDWYRIQNFLFGLKLKMMKKSEHRQSKIIECIEIPFERSFIKANSVRFATVHQLHQKPEHKSQSD